jgi:hypothetical protein
MYLKQGRIEESRHIYVNGYDMGRDAILQRRENKLLTHYTMINMQNN